MSSSICVHDLRLDDFSVLNVIKLKLFCSSKVLKDFSLIIRYCNTHNSASFPDEICRGIHWFKFTASTCYDQVLAVG